MVVVQDGQLNLGVQSTGDKHSQSPESYNRRSSPVTHVSELEGDPWRVRGQTEEEEEDSDTRCRCSVEAAEG